VPGFGIYAGAADGHLAAISIGTNPHYGGDERRIEAFLLDFAGDLYGKRLTLELWQRLRDEQAFGSEAELIAHCEGKLARFKVPRHVRFVASWPMSTSKIQKFRLRDQLVEELEQGAVA